MKIRNKKTGEIINNNGINFVEGNYKSYNSLAELNEEWEDYEEPEGWCITMYGGISRITKYDEGFITDLKEIGNYFETEEEAEQAVEKLKAWKRLKDKGFKFISKTYETDKRFGSIFYKVDEDTYSEDIIDELDICFGGEE